MQQQRECMRCLSQRADAPLDQKDLTVDDRRAGNARGRRGTRVPEWRYETKGRPMVPLHLPPNAHHLSITRPAPECGVNFIYIVSLLANEIL
jgi:hypothetical protein